MCLKDNKKPQQPEVEEESASSSTTIPESASGFNDLKTMTPDIVADMADVDTNYIVLVVRDLSTGTPTMSKRAFFQNLTSTVGYFFADVSKFFLYEVNSFALTYQKSDGETVELNELDPNKPLGDIGFTAGANNWNNLILTNLHGSQPKKIEEEELSLGASASPTSSISEIRPKCYKNCYTLEGKKIISDSSADIPSSATRIKLETVGYVGLVNQAMTCYLNSLLQTLFMTPEFRNALYRWEFKGSEEAAAKSIPYQLQKLFLLLQNARSAVETTNLTKSFGWDSSEVWQQHDIQELYRVMFDALEQCFKNTDQAEFINNLYEGKMKDYVKCLDCGTENAREDSFLDIPLPIRPFGSSTAYKSVEEALKAFVEPELLTENNKYECSKCNTHCDAHKGLKFTRFPYLLTLHLKRFDFDYQTFHRIKLNDKVTFPNILDLNGFIEDETKEISNEQNNVAQVNSPDKCFAEKLDDASTTDSGAALDAEESSSVGFSASNQTSNDADTQDEDEGIDVSSVYNEKNRLLCISNGPYVYELFSIMVHSGSASGGHYYAYIKDLKTGEWFCFNDQSVSRITYDDIRKTYGGPNSRGYYSSWSSSANAYMLMYRQADKERNVDIFSDEEFPPHVKELVQKMVSEEAAEREAREIDRMMCKIKLFCRHPNSEVLVEHKFKVHKETTLKDATKLAYQELRLEEVVPLERCRLVKYEEVHDSIECSFTNQDSEVISEVLGGVKSAYKFGLLMEIRDENKEFEDYKPGGITIKVHVINLDTEEVEGPQVVRAAQTQTVRELKELLGRSFGFDPDKMRIIIEKYYNVHKALIHDMRTLKDEGFYRSNKIYIEASGEEAPNFFSGSQLYTILDRYENTISLHCNLPERSPEVLKELQIPPYDPNTSKETETQKNSQSTTQEVEVSSDKDKTLSKENILETETPTISSVTCSTSSAPVTNSLRQPSTVAAAAALLTPPTTPKEIPSKRGSKSPKSPQKSCSPSPYYDFGVSAAVSKLSHSPTAATGGSLSDTSVCSTSSTAVNLSDEDDAGADGELVVGSSSSTVNSDQSASEDSSLTSDSDRTLVGDPPEDNLSDHSPDYHNVSSPEDNPKDDKNENHGWGPAPPHSTSDAGWGDDDEAQNVKRYFRAHLSEPDVLKVSVDKRITIGQLKNELQKYVGVAEEHFKLYKYYINSHEFECTRMTETLFSYGDNNVMKVRLGRALLPGEFKGKVFLLVPENSEEPAKFLIDFVVRKGEMVSKVKQAIVKEVNAKCGMNLDPSKLRLRKKSWKNPQTIFLDHQLFDDDIMLYANWEYYLQVIDGPEQKSDNPDELSLFLKRFYPSTYKTQPLVEIILSTPTAEALCAKISETCGIPVENVEFAKGKATFPCDMPVYEIPTELDWTPKSGLLDKRPIYVIDDGAVMYYRDSSEPLKQLTESEKNDLVCAENARLNRDYHSASTVASSSVSTSSRIREKGLKIYLNQSSSSSNP